MNGIARNVIATLGIARNGIARNGFGGGGVSPPLEGLRQWLYDVASGGASLKDKKTIVTPTPIPAEVPILEFGSGSKATSNIEVPEDDWYISMWVYPTAVGFYDELVMSSARTGGLAKHIFLRFFSNTLELACRIGEIGFRSGALNVLTLNNWQRVVSKRTGGEIVFEAYEANGTQLFSVNAGTNTDIMETGTIEVGATTSSREYVGLLSKLKIGSLEGVTELFPMEEGEGGFCYGKGGTDTLSLSSVLRATSDGVPSDHLENGFGRTTLLGNQVKFSGNPVYLAAGAGGYDSQVRYPSVLRVSDTDWRMFLYQRTGNGGTVYATYMTSTDGITWTAPNLGLVSYGGNTNNNIIAQDFKVTDVIEYDVDTWLLLTETFGGSDQLHTIPKDMSETPTLLVSLSVLSGGEAKCIERRIDGTYLMLGTIGQGNPGSRTTVKATSDTSDLTGTWTYHGTQFPFISSSSTDQYYSQAITVINGVWYSAYSDYNGITQTSRLGLAASYDEGDTWAILDATLVPLGGSGDFDEYILWASRMFLVNGKYRLYYMGLEDQHYSPTGKDGGIGYTDLEIISSGAFIPANASDPTKDVLGRLLSNPPGPINNGACKTTQSPTATQLLDKIIVDGVDWSYGGVINGKSSFGEQLVGTQTYYTSTNWSITDWAGAKAWEHPTATGIYPPKTGYVPVAPNTDLAPALDYSSARIADDGTRKALSLAEELALVNGADNCLNKFVKGGVNKTCLLAGQIHYNQGITAGWTEAELAQAGRWANNDLGCGTGILEAYQVVEGNYQTVEGLYFIRPN